MYLYLTCPISYGANLYLDFQNINTFNLKKQDAIGANLAICLKLVSTLDVISVKLMYGMVITVTYFIRKNLSSF
jgi:hypothetical protein